jgi:catechol 2,3-dioxygenase-like lactoylglutathione lyase family enzyme
MSRVQLALNVDDIDAAVVFYSQLFDAEPAKRRPGYANFALDEPALKLVLIENTGHGGSLNHLGVEVGSTEEVAAATRRYAALGMPTRVQDGTTCCYALQDKIWVTGPSGEPWEIYTVLADAGAELDGKTRLDRDVDPGAGSSVGCCGTDADTLTQANQTASAGACCPD